ncbi:hypothetical protein ABMY12_20680 [Vibrio vulnificus]|uniref:hypothetical protein n=1 Tax=Vibrio vulnificus TaxID=672 RepID=UPI004058705E
MSQALKNLVETLDAISLIDVLNVDEVTQSVGVSFSYLGIFYTVYFSANTQQGELLRHDGNDITKIENVGRISAVELARFVASLPQLVDIAR